MSKELFISRFTELITNELKSRGCYHIEVVPAIVAMACIEGRYGESVLAKNYHNHFGMKCGQYWKGKSVNLSTREEYTAGTVTVIKDNFRAYNTDEEGVKGFFDFIATNRYANLQNATTPREFLEMIKSDGYATSSTYVETCMTVVNSIGSNSAAPTLSYKVGNVYTLLDNMAVRKAPSKNSPLVGYKGLTADGKKHDVNKNGYLDKGTQVTCKDVYLEGAECWIKCPSGWMCAYDSTSVYIR